MNIRTALNKVSAWQVRIVTLACLVVLVGSSLQVLINAFAVRANVELSATNSPITSITTIKGPNSYADNLYSHKKYIKVSGLPGGYVSAGAASKQGDTRLLGTRLM